ncbi:MAG: dihydrolipoyl dehydrogenase [Treponema sp.]|jgi:dihydrolipoamide dehydrogenase|nr:dihydrolipoyl dehydrogenase [Treponema sp.]
MYDTIIIGGGPGGYLAAERLGQAKKKVLVIEAASLGGTCLNAGCIPTKTLLNAAKHYVHAQEAHKYGLTLTGVSFDWGRIQRWKTEVVEKLRAGLESQMKGYGVTLAAGRGAIREAPSGDRPGTVQVALPAGGTEEHTCRTILVAPGSVPVLPPLPGIHNNPAVVDSTGLLAIETVPEKLVVIGGGVIGVEFAGLFAHLGTEVTVIEMTEEILPFMDHEQAPLFRRTMKKVRFKLGCRVEEIRQGTVHLVTKEGNRETLEADKVLMAVGRKAVLDTWGAKAAGVDSGPRGIMVDDRMRTNVPGIWAAGDVTGKSLLAHAAYRMAEVAVADILRYVDGTPKEPNRMRYDAVPWAVYGITEAAGVGITEQEAAVKGIPILKASLPMRRSGRFVAENTFAGQGAVKVIADAGSRRILGVHGVGAYASEFIWGGAVLIEQELSIEEVQQLIFPHPTVGELIRDAVWELA